ncbi:NAD(P)/FAD-dependent oxidoreductase [Haloparvum sedimenti]|uniref:NAD(P)/FAD-dependent oxidoreductase n=1 Tax=Haloparvum sedimenti TaxID=1678448 RepID=UPI00071E8B1E|nr:FAD-dependent oxidoreductase [Haloparvum sedimenti]
MPPHVAVVGGGAVGVTTAGDLAARGADVTLFERETVASGSSGRAAGVLYDAYAEDVDAELAARSMERFRDLAGPGPEGFSFSECPYVIAVREGDETAEALPATVERMRTHDRAVSLVAPEELADAFPLETDDLAAAAVAENAGYVDPAAYTEAMASRARELGVEIREGTPVGLPRTDFSETADGPALLIGDDKDGGDRDDPDRERFDAVVVAAGAHTKRLFAAAGRPLAIKPYRVQALTSAAPYDGPMVYDATAGVYFRPHPTGLLGGDGTEPVEADPDTYDRIGDDWFVDNVAAALRERAEYAVDPERAWAGLCTATPDGDPLLGEVEPGLFVAAGWQGHGFMRAPAHAEALAEMALERAERGLPSSAADAEDSLDAAIAPFDPTRFSGAEEFEIAEGMSVENR